MSTRLFSSLSKPQVDFLATCLQECTYSVGEKLWAASDAIETLYILREGNMHTQGSLTHTVPLRFAMPLSDTAAAVPHHVLLYDRRGRALCRGDA